ncbi:MAG: glycosyltransferase family 2 protein [Spirochaetota bacterium]|mgnify:FL=1
MTVKNRKQNRVALVILTRNEIDGMTALVEHIPFSSFTEVFAVDGGSTDGTLALFQKHRIKVYSQTSRGRGEAFRIAAERTKAEYIIFFSPDGNEDPADILKFLPYADGSYDMVIASRMMKGAHNEEDDQPIKMRKWANNAFNLMANALFNRSGRFITDSINGYRMIRRAVFDTLKPDGRGYTIEYQMTIRAMKARLRIAEFPTHEGPRIGGESYAKSIPTGIAFLKLLFSEIFTKKR